MNDLPTWSNLNKGVRKMTDKEFEYCEEMEKRKHDEKLKELREVQLLSQHILDLQKDKGKLTDRVKELEAQINRAFDVLTFKRKRIAELEAQIEKMKNFQNCDYQLHVIDCPIFKCGGHMSCKECPHWILQEIKENENN